MRVAVIGGGPVGVAAAIGALERDHEVTLLERDQLGASLLTWGPVRFFSPFSMNATPRMRELLGSSAPAGDELLTGAEYVARVLRPLAATAPLAGRVRENVEVVAVGRRGLTRADFAGHPLRTERAFQLVLRAEGRLDRLETDVILDASGGLRVPRFFGAGGLPASLPESPVGRVITTLGGLAEKEAELAGARVLLVGNGHSAAHAIAWLAELAGRHPRTSVVWVVRTASRRPCEEVANDPLPERKRVVSFANDVAEAPPAFLRIERRTMIDRVFENRGAAGVLLTSGAELEVDAIVAFTGYGPGTAYHSELAPEVSPVTEGGWRLARAIANVSDCLSVPSVRPADLESGEPGFYFIGSRAWGRSSRFLLRSGLAQLEVILDGLE